VAGTLLLAGASVRYSVFKAGFESAADPAYVVSEQRGHIAQRVAVG